MALTLGMISDVSGQACRQSALVAPTPFMGNGGEIIELGDGSFWKEVSYQYLYLCEYYPSVTICPEQGVLILGENRFSVIPVSCRKAVIEEPTPFMGNGGELILLDDGSLWQDASFLYLYLYEYNPSVVICPDEGVLQLGDNQFAVVRVRD